MEETEIRAEEPKQEAKGKLWTQEEVDAYSKVRNDKQRAKYAEQLAAKDEEISSAAAKLEEASKQLADAQQRLAAMEHAKELEAWKTDAASRHGIPAAILRGDSQEEIEAHAAQIKEASSLYPSVNPNVANNRASSGASAPIGRDEILSERDPNKRLALVMQNKQLFPELGNQ